MKPGASQSGTRMNAHVALNGNGANVILLNGHLLMKGEGLFLRGTLIWGWLLGVCFNEKENEESPF